MKRIIKRTDSKILLGKLSYGTKSHRQRIREILIEEQDQYCAYTEERVTAGFAMDIEHFDPTRKYSKPHDYNNWFAASARWNQRKSTKWENFQPLLHPTASDFEKRVILRGFIYGANQESDIEAQNLCDFLQLNDRGLVDDREDYLQAHEDLMQILDGKEHLYNYLLRNPSRIKYRRLLETHFGFFFPAETA